MELRISLKASRVNAGLTLDAVAKHIKVSPKTVSSWERGLTPIPKVAFDTLCGLYNIPSDSVVVPRVDDGKFVE